MFPNLRQFPVIALDVETFGVEWVKDRMFSFSVSTPDDKDYYFDTREHPRVLEWLGDEVKHCTKIVNHNIDFDAHMLANEGVLLDLTRAECTMIRAALIDEHLRAYSLDFVAKKYLGEGKDDTIYEKLASMFGGSATRNAQMKNIGRAPSSIVEPYAKRDTRAALNLWFWQEGELDRQKLRQVESLEKRLFPHVFDMERRGIRVDVNLAHATMGKLTVMIDKLQRELNDVAGFPVNPNPSGSIQKLFAPQWVPVKDPTITSIVGADGKTVALEVVKTGQWLAKDGTILAMTEAGKPSIGADQLRAMKDPAAALILRCRKLMKARDTFLAKHVLEHQVGGYVHPNINQVRGDAGGDGDEGTRTGRLSYTRPALQQIPARDKEIAAIIKPVFLPDEGMGWSSGDLEQAEFRVFAHYTNSPALIKAYKENSDLDIHQAVADMTGLPRSASYSGQANAKQMNLAMVFNMGGGALAEKMGLPFTMEKITIGGREVEYKAPGEEAKEVIERYFAAIPGVKELAKEAKSVATSRGYVRTLMGRHLRFPGKQFTHKASGLIYQGTSADINKDNIIRICEYLKANCPDARLIVNCHDSYEISIEESYACLKHLKALKEEIQRRPELRVMPRIDFSKPAGDWWEGIVSPLVTK